MLPPEMVEMADSREVEEVEVAEELRSQETAVMADMEW
jgi:hypothetical protein